MGANPGVGKIITVQDFVDMMIYYLMPPEVDYGDKITVVLDSGFRFNIKKDMKVGCRPWCTRCKSYLCNNYRIIDKSGTHASDAGQIVTNKNPNVDMWDRNYYKAKASDYRVGHKFPKFYDQRYFMGTNVSNEATVTKIIDPADNSSFGGINNHKVDMPVPGHLISFTDIKNILNETGSKMYKYNQCYVYNWSNPNWTNSGDEPNSKNSFAWSNGGKTRGSGWNCLNSWYYSKLEGNITNLYDSTVGSGALASLNLNETMYIATYDLQAIVSGMYYNTNLALPSYSIHVISCHHNCHSSCHCARW